MKLQWLERFAREYHTLPDNIREATDEKLRLLLQNIRHPSLRVKKMERWRGVYEGSITMNYRFTFHLEGDTYALRRIGTHNILRRP